MKYRSIVQTAFLVFALGGSALAQTMPTTPTQPTLPQIRTLPTQPNQLQRGVGESQEKMIEDLQKRRFIEGSENGAERRTYRDAPQTGQSTNILSNTGSSATGR